MAGSFPIQFFPPRNFNFGSLAQDLYAVGVGYQYDSVADAIAAATAASVTSAVIEVHNDLTENLEIPEGMTVKAIIQQGYPTITLTGSVRAIAGTGFANIIGFKLVGDGTEATIVADSAANLFVSECIVVNSGDFALVFSDTNGVNMNLVDCSFVSSAATAPMFDISNGNISTLRCGNLTPTSGIFASISAGTLTDIGSSFSGQIITSVDGGFDFVGSSLSVATGSCIDHDGSFISSLVRCSLSGSATGDVLSGYGQINISDITKSNNAQTYEATLDVRSYAKAPDTFYPGGAYELAAGDTLAPGQFRKIRVVSDGGAVTLTSTPTIDTSTLTDGDRVYIEGTSDTDTLTFQDEATLPGSKLVLNNGTSFTVGLHDNISFIYNQPDDLLLEVGGRNDLA